MRDGMRNIKNICYNCMRDLSREGCVCPNCGWDNAVRDNGTGYLQACVLNNQYFVGHKLGEGGFGVTYLGFDLRLNRRVAIKEYFPKSHALRTSDNVTIKPYSDSDSQEIYRWGLQRAIDEGRTTADLSAVPNTVQLYNAFQANGTVYLVMEYIEGTTLAKRVKEREKRNEKMPWSEVMGLMRPIMEALEAIHEKGVIHRDVSPDNIMLRANSTETVLLDFGAARPYENLSQGMTQVVRPGFGPAEQYSSKAKQDGRTDEYALCATMYYMLTGAVPPAADMLACGADQLKSPRELGAEISGEAQAVLLKGMSARMEDRYPNVRMLREAFEAAKSDGPYLDTIIDDSNSGENSDSKSKQEKEQKPIDVDYLKNVVFVVDSEGNAELHSQPESESQSDAEAWNDQQKKREEEAQKEQDPSQEENPIHWPEDESEPEPEEDDWKAIAKAHVFVIAMVFIALFVGTRIINAISESERRHNQTVVVADDYEAPVTKGSTPTPIIGVTPTPKPTPTKTPAPYYPTLKRKDKGDDVRDLQMELIKRNYLYDIVDGSFGKKTETAVKLVQEDAGLPVTGIADSQTRNALISLKRDFEPQADNQLMIIDAGMNIFGDMEITFKNMGRNTVTGYEYDGYQCNASKKDIGDLHGRKNTSRYNYGSVFSIQGIAIRSGETWTSWITNFHDGYQGVLSNGEAYTRRFFDNGKYARFVLTKFTTEDGKTHKVSEKKNVYAEIQ